MNEHSPQVLPYSPPSPPQSHVATVFRAIGTVLATAAAFGIGGGGVGLLLGVAVPGYYRGVFRSTDPAFDAVAVGFGLGVGQGLAAGVLAGVVLAGILAWREVRMEAIADVRAGRL